MRLWILGGVAVLVAGCASPPSDPFASVKRTADRQTHLTIDRPPRLRGPAKVPDDWLAEPLTVDSAVRIALAYNRKLAVAYDELDVSQAELTQAGLLKNPVLDLSVRLPDRSPRKTYLDFGMGDSIVDLLLIGARKRLAESSLNGTQATATHTVIQTVADVRAVYFAAAAAEQTRQLRQTVLDTAKAADVAADQLHQAGNVPEIQTLQTHSATLRAQGDLLEAQARVDQIRAKLADLLGLGRTQTHWKLADALPDLPDVEKTGDWETLALDQRQDLAAAKATVAVAAQRLGITTDTRFWGDLTAGAEAERETDGQWRIGPTIAVPIPLFDQGQAAIAIAKAQLQKSVDEYQALRLEVLAQVRCAQSDQTTSRATALLYRDEVLPTQQKLLDQTLLRYNGMYDSLFVLLEAKQMQTENAIKYVDALRAYWTASAELDAAVGGRVPVLPGKLTTHPAMESSDMENMDMHMQHR